MQCILPQNQTTPEKTLSNPWFGKGFCEPDQYKAAIDRCEGGYRSCELGIDIYTNLTKILDDSAKAIQQWSRNSQKQIGQSKEFGTTKKTWLHSIRAVEKLAERNNEVSKNIQKMVIDKMSSYKSENYGKSFIHVKKIKEFEKEFKKTQKSWLELIDRISDTKQAFHTAKRKFQQAENGLRITEGDAGSSDEQKENAKTNVEIHKKEMDKCRTKYDNRIKDMEKAKPDYQTKMFKILEDTDNFELKRLNHFNLMFTALHDAITTNKDKYHDEMVLAFKTTIGEHNAEADISYFNQHYGKDTKTKWPVFEDLQ